MPAQSGKPAYSAADLAKPYPLWGKCIFPAGGAPTLKERISGRRTTFGERLGNAARTVGSIVGGHPKYGAS